MTFLVIIFVYPVYEYKGVFSECNTKLKTNSTRASDLKNANGVDNVIIKIST